MGRLKRWFRINVLKKEELKFTVYFNYKLQIIQTIDGKKFSHTKKIDRVYSLDVLLNELNMVMIIN